jgi:hypothetical protein
MTSCTHITPDFKTLKDLFYEQQEEAISLHNIAISVIVTVEERSAFQGSHIYEFLNPIPRI